MARPKKYEIEFKDLTIIIIITTALFMLLSPGVLLTLPPVAPSPPTPGVPGGAGAGALQMLQQPQQPGGGQSKGSVMFQLFSGNKCTATSLIAVLVHGIVFMLLFGIFFYVFMGRYPG
jgi:hypothetical protein